MSKYSEDGIDDVVLNLVECGFYVDVGAADGVNGSNTKLLEENWWDGICIEPHPANFEQLVLNRKCLCDNSLVDGEVKEVTFVMQEKMCQSHSLSHQGRGGSFIKELAKSGSVESLRKRLGAQEITRKTDILVNILDKYQIPRMIHFLKLDTEGSETDIIRTFDFDKYQIWIISCEEPTNEFKDIMQKHGFTKNIPLWHDIVFLNEQYVQIR